MGNLRNDTIVIFVNITKQCNINCPRCYLTPESRRERNVLPADTLKKLVDNSFFKGKEIIVIWEGGEPSLIGKDAFISLIDVIDSILPNAKQGIVTNLFNLPSWLIDIISTRFYSWCETTFAMDRKYSLDGDKDKYLRRFSENIKKLRNIDIDCPVNIELNDETIKLGSAKLVEFMINSEQKHWDIDVSIDFPEFYQNPSFVNDYPILPQTTTNYSVTNFLRDIYTKHWDELEKNKIRIDPLFSIVNKEPAYAFNVGKEAEFITINPDGTITTNPLFSDIKQTYLGNINTDNFEDILENPKRINRIIYEEERISSCTECIHLESCNGGPSHVPVFDASGECVSNKRIRDIFSIGI